MRVVPLLAAASFLVCSPAHAESSCEAVNRLTDQAERTLKSLHLSPPIPKAMLQTVTRDLEIATQASHACSDRNTKLHLAAVKALLADTLLSISDIAAVHR